MSIGGVVAALDHEEAGRVDADVVDQLVERHELALALRHPRALAALDDLTSCMIGASKRSRVGRAPRSPRASGHVAVVVGAEDVDQLLGAPLELVAVVGDVGGEVGRLAVRADQHPVLVVAELGRPQPDRALALVYVPALAELARAPRRPRPPRAARARRTSCRSSRRSAPASPRSAPASPRCPTGRARRGLRVGAPARDLARRARRRSRPRSRPRGDPRLASAPRSTRAKAHLASRRR